MTSRRARAAILGGGEDSRSDAGSASATQTSGRGGITAGADRRRFDDQFLANNSVPSVRYSVKYNYPV